MDMHPVKIVFWVNSACFWRFCAFVLASYDDIMQVGNDSFNLERESS